MSQNGVDDEVEDDVDDYDDAGPPYFPTDPPKNHTRAIGEGIRIKCPVEGNPTPNITWMKDGETMQRPVESKHWTLIVQDLTLKDTGNYTCVICNVHGCVNFTTYLRIKGMTSDAEEDYPESTQLNTTEDGDLVSIIGFYFIFILACTLYVRVFFLNLYMVFFVAVQDRL